MKRIGTIITLTVILIAFVFGIRYIYLKDQKDPVVYETQSSFRHTILKKNSSYWEYSAQGGGSY